MAMAKSYKTKKGYRKWKDSGEYVHRTQAEKKVGGSLWPGRVVHHKDGNRENNEMSNLQIMSRREHSRMHNRKKRRYR